MKKKNRYIFYDRWFRKHDKDWYVRQARQRRLRSRAWFKLEEIDNSDSLFRIGMTVIDLGASPGGWSLYVKEKVGLNGCVIACDILPMNSISGVDFFNIDCSDFNIIKILLSRIGGYQKSQVVLSDMSPNITGISIIDTNRSIYLGNVALNICRYFLEPGGVFLVKVFQGSEFEKYLYNIHNLFCMVKIRKPNSSRSCSREVYILAKGYKT